MTPELRATVERLEGLMAKATPGPWNTAHSERLSYIFANTKIADVWSTAFRNKVNQEANADLITQVHNALPALLAALREQAQQIEKLEDAEATLTSATDLLNTWAREVGTLEAQWPMLINDVVSRLKSKVRRDREEQEAEIGRLKERLRGATFSAFNDQRDWQGRP